MPQRTPAEPSNAEVIFVELCRGVGVQKCITYEDVNAAVAEAKERFSGGQVPPEIYELSSDTPTPEHVTIPAEIGN